MTEQEFLTKRMPFWLTNDDLEITFPTGTDRKDMHSYLCKKYHYNWMYALRGYYWPGSHVMLYSGDYETPNCTINVAQYLLNYFKDAAYVGIGCNKGKVGEIWEPKVIVTRNLNWLKNDLSSNKSE